MTAEIELSYRKRSVDPADRGLPVTEVEADGEILSMSTARTTNRLTLSQLTPKDRSNFFVLVGLYLLQGIPNGLAFGSIPFILKAKLSYGQVGIFTLATYPYSLKLLWSPIVDAFYNRAFGRRKSWIVPIQACSTLVLLYLGATIEPYMDNAEQNLGIITLFFFTLVFLSATQDIAVDGWALTLLSPPALPYASTAQTVGLNTGYFMSFTVFLALNSPDFANRYLRPTPIDAGLVSLSGYLTTWGILYGLGTVAVALFKREDRARGEDVEDGGIRGVYRSMVRVLRLRHVQTLICVHLVAKFAFQANEAVTNLKLVERGLSKEDLALIVLIDFPFEIIFGYYAAKWSSGANPLDPWLLAFLGRLGFAALSMLSVAMFPADGPGFGYLVFVTLCHVLGSFMSTVQFVCINAFHTQIADPLIGGTYMTVLNTISNLGGQWPRLIVLYGVDYFTRATCQPPTAGSTLELAPFSCATEADKARCKTAGGVCTVEQDGYFVMNVFCIAVGLALFFGWIKHKMHQLQRLPVAVWRVSD